MADREEEETVVAPGGEDQEHGGAAGEEEDTGAQVAPIVRLEEVAVSTGEENEDVLLEQKAKLYRYDQSGKQWKERGVGVVKILQDGESKKTRVLMRQQKTLKICANHYLRPGMNLQEHAGSDKSWVWYAMDYSDGEVKSEMLCIRFGSTDNAQKFKDVFTDATESQTETTDAADVAKTLDKLSVKDLSSDPIKDKASKLAEEDEKAFKDTDKLPEKVVEKASKVPEKVIEKTGEEAEPVK